jgi:hypothetical protein
MKQYAKGDRVVQLQYGAGTVTDANERHTTIDFDEHGVRVFSTPIVKLERTTAPVNRPHKAAGARRTKKSAAPKATT